MKRPVSHCLSLCWCATAACVLLCLGCTAAKSPSTSQTTTPTAAVQASTFPHPDPEFWDLPNSDQPALFHGLVVRQSGIELCLSCHGADLQGAAGAVSCTLCHPGFPGNHRLLGEGASGDVNPDWGGDGATALTHHSKGFVSLTADQITKAVGINCTTQCHTFITSGSNLVVPECVTCHSTAVWATQ